MLRTAILSALPEEQAGLSSALQGGERIVHAGRAFFCGTLEGQDVVLALSGIGKVAAATTAAALVERFGAARIVFTGVAGGLGDGVQVGDVVVAHDYLQHDMDASPLFPRWELPGYGRARLACDPHLTSLLSAAVDSCLQELDLDTGLGTPAGSTESAARAPRRRTGLVASGDLFVSTATGAQALCDALRAASHDVLAIEMEGAAVAQVCADYRLAFAAVRTISDRADDTAHVDFARFVETVAARYADRIIRRFLRML
ncbi:5'-methylthioadenosine/adenosylhomocysteine nucleosidase [Paracidovorax cattleyae]|uniref:adenosylhomocysteine nucleosidase n=1 Tax=Paracidovorax cattleyae TaxID=80868 RepID=A0A1H0PFY9_9BURK|nr:5'-methylthioadenosine/adenosylhomocysteine nucleosidase [Paracidovorax cattleyae]AVS75994.1 5'-methylthioadenosine/adenosylhomocysteine nucleosidase [Paracidovorax cattleyae]MBF9265034.1 5'-methylthioadenosine/adenosylhomocysteine nucleosidase [Paracidovorax cattleyae]SDP03951.1 adenosylhomocysteine nucleosidase [Paracidovorax cattleyae]